MNRRRITFVLAALALVFATALLAQISAVKTDPADGAVVDQPVRNLRVWFDRAPDVESAELAVLGPAGELKVESLHGMGEDDLMGRVVGPMPDGEYTARWTAAGPDGQMRTGRWSFTIRRDQ